MATTKEPTKTRESVADRGDYVDKMLDVWVREIPSLDRLTEGIVERIGKAGSVRSVVSPPYRLSAGELADGLWLSSGAMTNRLDRLEEAGLVRRLPDPDDRRGVLVEPTKAGHAAWDSATDTQAGREALIASALSDDAKERLHSLLRRLMRAFPHEVRAGARRKKAEE